MPTLVNVCLALMPVLVVGVFGLAVWLRPAKVYSDPPTARNAKRDRLRG